MQGAKLGKRNVPEIQIAKTKTKTNLAVGGKVVGVPGLLAPGTLDGVAVHVRVVHGDDGVGRRLLRGKPAERKIGK